MENNHGPGTIANLLQNKEYPIMNIAANPMQRITHLHCIHPLGENSTSSSFVYLDFGMQSLQRK